jgi:hypothetical protein
MSENCWVLLILRVVLYIPRCCIRTISNPRATLTASFTALHALTSISIWDQSGHPLLQADNQLTAFEISIGTKQSMTGCLVTNLRQSDRGTPTPPGFEQKGLLCGSAGIYLAISVSKLLGMSVGSSKPKGEAIADSQPSLQRGI